MRMAALLILAALLWGGCSLGDCADNPSRGTTTGARLSADGTGVGDTLTVAFVTGTDPAVAVVTLGDLVPDAEPTPDGTVEIVFDAESVAVGAGQVTRPFATATRRDTVFVYASGSLDPSVFALACSLPPAGVTVEVREVRAPAGTVAVRIASVPVDGLSAPASPRQPAEPRALARTITT